MPMPTDRRVTRAAARPAVAAAIPDVTDAELDAALAAVDQDAVYDDERGRWTVQVWDRSSPVNGVPAEHFLTRGDVPADGDVYLLLRDGDVVVFQPHRPGVAGLAAIPRGQGNTEGRKHANQVAADRAVAEVTRRVAEHVTTARG